MRRIAALLLLLSALAPAGCAWANRDRRPVWDAFERNVVPESDGAFYATLPLTVPLGFVAILVDVFIANPILVFDDTAQEAGDLWDHADFENEYYYQSALAPARSALTAVYFVGAYFVNSFFDVPLRGDRPTATRSDPAPVESQEAADARLADELARWVAGIARSNVLVLYDGITPERATDALREEVAAVLATGTAHARASVWLAITYVSGAVADPAGGLSDPDPVVRYLVLARVSPGGIPASVREALRDDPSPAVRELAAERLGAR